jgi:hypothetical protein
MIDDALSAIRSQSRIFQLSEALLTQPNLTHQQDEPHYTPNHRNVFRMVLCKHVQYLAVVQNPPRQFPKPTNDTTFRPGSFKIIRFRLLNSSYQVAHRYRTGVVKPGEGFFVVREFAAQERDGVGKCVSRNIVAKKVLRILAVLLAISRFIN